MFQQYQDSKEKWGYIKGRQSGNIAQTRSISNFNMPTFKCDLWFSSMGKEKAGTDSLKEKCKYDSELVSTGYLQLLIKLNLTQYILYVLTRILDITKKYRSTTTFFFLDANS